jgi:serine protease Do
VTLDAELGEFPEDKKPVLANVISPKEGSGGSVTVLGLTMAQLNNELRARFKLAKDTVGVVVTNVENNSPAAEKRIQIGSVIRKIGLEQERVSSPVQVRAKVESARKAALKSLLFFIERGGNSRFVALRLSKTKN